MIVPHLPTRTICGSKHNPRHKNLRFYAIGSLCIQCEPTVRRVSGHRDGETETRNHPPDVRSGMSPTSQGHTGCPADLLPLLQEEQMLALHYGKSRKPLAWVVPDARYPSMFRIKWPDGSLSDMVNLTRAKDAAMAMAERGASGGRRHLLKWKQCEDAFGADPVRLSA